MAYYTEWQTKAKSKPVLSLKEQTFWACNSMNQSPYSQSSHIDSWDALSILLTGFLMPSSPFPAALSSRSLCQPGHQVQGAGEGSVHSLMLKGELLRVNFPLASPSFRQDLFYGHGGIWVIDRTSVMGPRYIYFHYFKIKQIKNGASSYVHHVPLWSPWQKGQSIMAGTPVSKWRHGNRV